jgi:acetyl esterase
LGVGSPDWVYDAAKRYASSGAVAVAAEYRLSDQKSISPLDAMADARDIVHWMRLNSAELSIDPDRIAAYGVSAGGQLAASLATIDDGPANPISPAPNAMVFISPAVSVEQAPRVILSGFSPSNCTERTERKPACQTCQFKGP